MLEMNYALEKGSLISEDIPGEGQQSDNLRSFYCALESQQFDHAFSGRKQGGDQEISVLPILLYPDSGQGKLLAILYRLMANYKQNQS